MALLIAIAINLFMQFFGISCKKINEGMNSVIQENINNQNTQQVMPSDGIDIGAPVDSFGTSLNPEANSNVSGNVLPLQASVTPTSAPQIISATQTNSENVMSELAQETQTKSENAVNKIVQLQQENQDLSKTCPLKGTQFENDRYVREFVLGGKFNCNNDEPSKKFTRSEIIQYQNNMLDFYDQVHESTSNTVDVVDKINELYTSGSKSLTQGQTISSVFDGLTQNQLNKKKGCANPSCLIPPQIDKITKSALYKGTNAVGNYYRNGLMYEDDDVNTGAKYYNNVEGTDTEFEDNLSWE